jgi:hypothetical protein
MKTRGFSAGLCNDGTTTCASGNGDIVNWSPYVYNQVQWKSSNTGATQPGIMFIGIRPKVTVSWVSGTGVSPIWISTRTPLDMATGDRITLYQIAAASGVRFTNGMLELRGKGMELQLVQNGVVTPFTSCEPYQIPKPPA